MEIRKLLKQYIFSSFVIICVAVLFIGITTVKEKTQYNMDFSRSAIVNRADGKLVIEKNDEKIIVDKKYLSQYRYETLSRIVNLLKKK